MGMPTRRRASAAAAGSAHRPGVDQAAAGPEIVNASRQAEWGLRPEVPLVDLAIVADRKDGIIEPARRELHRMSEVGNGAEDAPDCRVRVAASKLLGIGARHAKFLRLDQAEEHPADNVEPLLVVAAHYRAVGLL